MYGVYSVLFSEYSVAYICVMIDRKQTNNILSNTYRTPTDLSNNRELLHTTANSCCKDNDLIWILLNRNGSHPYEKEMRPCFE